MAKAKVKKLYSLKDYFQGESNDKFYKIKTTTDQTYILDKFISNNYYLVLDYSSLKPSELSCSYAIRQGDDLIFVAEIFKGSKLSKTITTTIKEYYLHYQGDSVGIRAIDTLALRNESSFGAGNGKSYKQFYWNEKTDYLLWNTTDDTFDRYPGGGYSYTTYHPYTYAKGIIKDSEYSGNIAGSNGTDNYIITNNGEIEDIYDHSGDDTYTMAKGYINGTIYDYKGNDIYGAYDSSIRAEDFSGNDYYKINYGGNINVTDYAGNDIYSAYKTDGESHIDDFAGNDVYNAINVDSEFFVNDEKGNDKYFASNVYDFEVTDSAGNDSYTVIDLDLPYIHDYKGNDTYNMTNISGASDNYSKIIDDAGNDKYDLNNVDYFKIEEKKGSDKYVIKKSDNVSIHDYETSKKAAKDTYLITDDSCVHDITDDGGNDVYTISNNSKIDDYIDDLGGKDKYTVTNNSFANIEDEGKANDAYNVSVNSTAYIYDEDGKDTYNIDLSSYARIDDRAGKDTLNLLGAKADDLVFMANYKTKTPIQKNDVSNGSLFIFNKSTGAYIEIENYFTYSADTNGNNYINGNGIGYIENIKAGKKSMNSVITEYATAISGGVHADALGSAVAQWLSDNHYSTDTYTSISKIMDSNIADEFIATFVAQQ